MEVTSAEWIEACIHVMNQSMYIGARLYPLICAIGLIRMIIENV